jgi:hypothetical protein
MGAVAAWISAGAALNAAVKRPVVSLSVEER